MVLFSSTPKRSLGTNWAGVHRVGVVAQCRRALGDSAARQQVIKTVPKRGYRLVPDIVVFRAGALAGMEPT